MNDVEFALAEDGVGLLGQYFELVAFLLHPLREFLLDELLLLLHLPKQLVLYFLLLFQPVDILLVGLV